ncbi:sodium:phosphate symporter [Paenibacillus sp. 598K]|uniref:Na/Pi cotransporter family protein n=1 Tax=Paenibacillus sp. 598K TaxID=1117987 RepID=UPI000FFA015E|nr:Na/Pi cotransporter family protein [Paenibacillus sp. 598K]GBF74847.1 sodium:phosphate symporter [Paenibacillus sp. 598K]
MDWQEVAFKFIGGLGIFLFGIKYMSDGLQKSAGDKMRGLLEKYTSNPFLGVLFGIVVTILIQSSTGTTVMAIGLINAGLMTLRQAIGVIMGANIGTTMTAFIVGIKIESYALPIIGLGAILLFFVGRQKVKYVGQVVFGFGMLFLGLSTMGSGLKPLSSLPAFSDFIVDMSQYPILGLIAGTIFTVIIQSSTAAIGILQTLADEGMISFRHSLPILFGDNLGTTITAVLASIGASVAARRAALVHVVFNVFGVIIFMTALPLMYNFIMWVGADVNVRLQIAYAHGAFNVANTMIFFPLIPFLAWIVTKLVPGKMEDLEFAPKFLDNRLLATPSMAVGQAQHEILRMGKYAREALEDAAGYFLRKDAKLANKALQKEQLVNELERKITDYMVQIHQNGLPEADSERASGLMHTVNDIERISDHAENIVELTQFCTENKVDISDEAEQELKQMMELADQTVGKAIYALEHHDREAAAEVMACEAELDRMEKDFRAAHIARLNQNLCSGNSGAIFLDIISNLERVGDHSKNIAEHVLKTD